MMKDFVTECAISCVEDLMAAGRITDTEQVEIVERNMNELLRQLADRLSIIAAASPTQSAAISFAVAELRARPDNEAQP
jgi:hypothetical protein